MAEKVKKGNNKSKGKAPEGYEPKKKPKLTPEKKRELSLRASKKQKEPPFKRQEWFRYGKLGESWRKPRGLHSKARRNLRYRAPNASIGYGKPTGAKGLHPSGFEEVMVHRPKDLEIINPELQAARIGSTVGEKKRIAIEEKADELGIRILNRRG